MYWLIFVLQLTRMIQLPNRLAHAAALIAIPRKATQNPGSGKSLFQTVTLTIRPLPYSNSNIRTASSFRGRECVQKRRSLTQQLWRSTRLTLHWVSVAMGQPPSASLASIAVKYDWRHGRRYHGYQSGKYSFPNDDTEQDRLNLIHHVFYLLLVERLFLAPIRPEGLRILDLGTGTGIWSVEMADLFPGAEVVGNDLSPIQPQWAPPNVKFYLDDVEADWAEPIQYDFIHCRYMAGSIKDWPRLVSQIYDNLKPGGWVEFQESANTLFSEDTSLASDNPMVQMMEYLTEACEKLGRTMDPAPKFTEWATAAGFESIKEQRFRLPIGSWPKDERLKEIGTLMSINFQEGASAFTTVLFTDVLGWSREEVEVFNASVRTATRDRTVHPMFDFVVVTGQKPV